MIGAPTQPHRLDSAWKAGRLSSTLRARLAGFRRTTGSRRSGFLSDTCFEQTFLKVLYAFLIFVPIAIVARLLGAPPIVVFVLAALAIVPLSGVMGAATETVAEHTSPAIGGVLSATMGNLAELIIASVALQAGLIDLVKASITGSILGNLLLVLGIALFAGGLKFKVQKFNRHLAGHSTTVLLIAVFGLVVPALFHALHPDPQPVATVRMSPYVAVLLIGGSEAGRAVFQFAGPALLWAGGASTVKPWWAQEGVGDRGVGLLA